MIVLCPVPDGYDCTYSCDVTGVCTLENPAQECDDYRAYVGDEEEEEEE